MSQDTVIVERVQTGVRIEKRLVKVMKALAEHKDMTLSDLIEGIYRLLHSDEVEPVNIGNPGEFTIKEFADLVNSLPPGRPFRVTFERGNSYSWVDLSFR